MAKQPIKFLSNKELLSEIHKSKCTYSSFMKPEYSDYDIILDDINNINFRTVMDARRNKAQKLTAIAYEEALKIDPKAKITDYEVNCHDVPNTDVVFRIMTYEHIPDSKNRRKSIKTIADTKERVNFPPFIHVILNKEGQIVVVGKSHWVGSLESGKFSTTHGQMTDRYALMLIKMCEKYTSKGNLRMYTYTDEMQSEALLQLTQAGLKFNEFKSDNPFSFLTTTIHNAVLRVLNTEKKVQDIRDDLLECHDLNPSYTRMIDHEYEAELRREMNI